MLLRFFLYTCYISDALICIHKYKLCYYCVRSLFGFIVGNDEYVSTMCQQFYRQPYVQTQPKPDTRTISTDSGYRVSTLPHQNPRETSTVGFAAYPSSSTFNAHSRNMQQQGMVGNASHSRAVGGGDYGMRTIGHRSTAGLVGYHASSYVNYSEAPQSTSYAPPPIQPWNSHMQHQGVFGNSGTATSTAAVEYSTGNVGHWPAGGPSGYQTSYGNLPPANFQLGVMYNLPNSYVSTHL